MKIFAYILGVTALSYSFAYAGTEADDVRQEKSLHHQFYLGPEVLVSYSQQEKFSEEGKFEEIFNSIIGGLRASYEYLKPHAFYFGTSGFIAKVKDIIEYRYDDGEYIQTFHLKSTPFLVNFEQRSGYTFQTSQKTLLTPFAGIGCYYFKTSFDGGLNSTDWFYGATGIRMLSPCFGKTENFDLGLNLKIMYSFAGRAHERTQFESGRRRLPNFWGYELALPFIWHAGTTSRWGLQFEPYLTKLAIEMPGQTAGARFRVEYGF